MVRTNTSSTAGTRRDEVAWYALETDEAVRRLQVEVASGLNNSEAARRLKEHGRNELDEGRLKSPWQILWEQLTATLVLVLIAAAAISLALGDYEDAGVILAIVVLNALLGFNQEYRAERALAALRQLAVPRARVRREGHVRDVPARELVPGDVVLLEAGNLVPADGRLLVSASLRAQEAALTGESEPVEKLTEPLAGDDLPVGDRRNLVYSGTMVTYGRGEAVVTATGMRTELGGIATLIQNVTSEHTPLQRRLDALGRTLAGAALALVGVIFVLGFLRGEELRLLFLTSISLAVAAVPEGLPAMVTIALALGAQRMLRRRALIRKLPAVETLGSVTVICSDKTGTLTRNRMTVTTIEVAGHREELGDALSVREPTVDLPARLETQPALALLLAGGALCNDAVLDQPTEGTQPVGQVGDPTEVALVVAAAGFGLSKASLEVSLPRVGEAPFDSERRRMTTVHRLAPVADSAAPLLDWRTALGATPSVAFTKGATDALLEVAARVWIGGRIEELDGRARERIVAASDRMAADGQRVLAVGFRPLVTLDELGPEALERDLVFVGLFGLVDPLRPAARDAVLTCRTAGIRPVMITGDHPLTALSIGRQLGLTSDGGILTGSELARLTPAELEERVAEVSVYARVAPEHKLQIVRALQSRGHVVAMTGDGVNDAPALKQADIGVAMGITGTDVSKEAADVVLLDDNFATIVAAVAEGRVLYDNIRKFIRYILTGNAAELWVMLLAPFLGMPLPLLPLQILWINLVTDGLPGLALSVEKGEPDTMSRPPHAPEESVFARGLGVSIVGIGLVTGLLSLGVGYEYWRLGLSQWQTMVFTTLTLSQMTLALGVRSEHTSLFGGLLENRPLIGAVGLTFVLQLAVIYVPTVRGFFDTTPLSVGDLGLSLGLSLAVFVVVRLESRLRQRFGRGSETERGRHKGGSLPPAGRTSNGAGSQPPGRRA